MSEDRARACVVAEARRWIGTPYHPGADVHGVGVDCGMLLVRVFVDTGLVPAFDPRPYPPAPGSVGDAMVHLQGPAEVLTILRELRELGRQQVEHLARIAECERVAREEARAQTELLRSIDREQVRNHGHDRRE